MTAILPVFGSEYDGFEPGEDDADEMPLAGWPNHECVICGEGVEFEGYLVCADCEAAIEQGPAPDTAPIESVDRNAPPF